MQIRRERTHNCGLSNVDFRRLNDKPKIRQFSEDTRETKVGTMGRTGLAYEFEHCGFGRPDTLLVNGGFKIPEPPNPRAATASEYYRQHGKPLRKPASVQRRRTKQLEDGIWNEKKFTGEDVKELTWYRNTVLTPEEELQAKNGGKSPKTGTHKVASMGGE